MTENDQGSMNTPIFTATPHDPETFTADDAGTWLDGSQGWHNTYRVIDRALSYGWQPIDMTVEDINAVTKLYASGEEGDVITLSTSETVSYPDACGWIIDQGGLSDMATEYLQSLAPEGYEFEWDMGELSLHETDEET